MLKKVENEIFEIVLKKHLHVDLFIFNKNLYEFCFVNIRDLLLGIRTMLDLTIKLDQFGFVNNNYLIICVQVYLLHKGKHSIIFQC